MNACIVMCRGIRCEHFLGVDQRPPPSDFGAEIRLIMGGSDGEI